MNHEADPGAGLALAELAARLGADLHGDGRRAICRVARLDAATPDAISFISDARYRNALRTCQAGAVLVTAELAGAAPADYLVVPDPYLAYARVSGWLNPPPPIRPGVHPSAVVDPTARIDPGAEIGPHCVIGAGAEVGPDCLLGPGCVLGPGARVGARSRLLARVSVMADCVLGEAVRVQPGAVIGSDGFGFARDAEAWVPIPQLGRAIVGDRVEIGANTTIDRGSLEDTVIEEGVILDNQIQVAHNVRIGARTAIAGCVGIAGSARIGRDCTIGGAATILGHLEIVDQVHITAMSMVTRSIRQPGKYSSGTVLESNRDWRRNAVRLRQLDRIARRLEALEKKFDPQE